MITYLRVENFRRHKEAELHFDQDAQLTLFAGENGNGKTTLAIEAPLYALYGQARHGRVKLDRLVRRGAELEGMQVELEFTHQDATYRVLRRRDSKVSTAILYLNDNPIVEGADAVTAEITKILGQDAQAFKIAGIAQQKELEGITKLTPAQRSQVLSRLLRLDVVTRAKKEARSIMSTKKSALEAMGPGEDLELYQEEITKSELELKLATAAQISSNLALQELDEKINQSSHLEKSYTDALTLLAAAGGYAAQAAEEVKRQNLALENTHIPPVVTMPETSLTQLIEEATKVQAEISEAQAQERVASHAKMLQAELDETTSRLDEIDQQLAGKDLDTMQTTLQKKQTQLQEAIDQLPEQKAKSLNYRDHLVTLKQQIEQQENNIQNVLSLDATCNTCQQSVPHSHKKQLEQDYNANLENLIKERKTQDKLQSDLDKKIVKLENTKLELEQETAALLNQITQMKTLNQNYLTLCQKKNTYTQQLERIIVQPVDMAALFEAKAKSTANIASAQAAESSHRLRDSALAKKANLEQTLKEAKKILDKAQQAEAKAAIPAELQQQYDLRQNLIQVKTDELALQAACATNQAVSSEKVKAAHAAYEQAAKTLEGKSLLALDASTAGNAAIILNDAELALNRSIRPSLEGGIASMLSLLSEGRFTQVAVDEDYNIKVGDDGALQPLEEFSGGELDLIALAIRLALSGVISERQGNPLGWMILDECFGALDAQRRRSVLSALRQLRPTIGQIWIISHVQGLDEECDKVITITDELDEFGRRQAVVD